MANSADEEWNTVPCAPGGAFTIQVVLFFLKEPLWVVSNG